MFFTLLEDCKTAFIEELQQFFQGAGIESDVVDERFRWSPDDQKTKIFIGTRYPEDEVVRNHILVRGGPGNSREIGFGQKRGMRFTEMVNEVEKTFQEFGGFAVMRITFELATLSEVERERLTDAMTTALAFFIRDKLAKREVIITPEFVQIGAEVEDRISESRVWYKAELSVQIHCNWVAKMEVVAETITETPVESTPVAP